MAKQFKVIRRGTSFNQYGPTPDTVLSCHKTYEAARKSFDAGWGAKQLIGPDGKVIDNRIV
jgi:hypothetical protein